MKHYSKIGWSTIATLSTVSASFLFNKIFSVYYGPAGLTLLSHLQNILAILYTIPQEGVNKGLIKFISGKNEESHETKEFYSAAISLHIASFIISIPLLYFLLNSISDLPAFLHGSLFLGITILSFFLQVVSLYIFTILLSRQLLKLYSIITILNSIAGVLLVYYYATINIFLASSMIFISPCIGLFLLLLSRIHFGISPFTFAKADKSKLFPLLKFVAIALSILVFGRLLDYFVRIYIIEQYNATATGYWQAAVRLSDGYTTIFAGILGISFFPHLSALINEKKDIKKFFSFACIQYLPPVFIGLALTYVFKEFFIELLFDKTLLDAGRFLQLQVIGDVFKFPSWLIVYIILAEGRMSLYIYLQFFSAISYLILMVIFTNHFGLIGMGYTHIFRYLIYFGLVVFLYRKKIF